MSNSTKHTIFYVNNKHQIVNFNSETNVFGKMSYRDRKSKEYDILNDKFKKSMHTNANVVEISSTSENWSRNASAFFLKVQTPDGYLPFENIYQAAKNFKQSGLQTQLLDPKIKPYDAKQTTKKLKNEGLKDFTSYGHTYPLEPKSSFYNYLYAKAMIEHPKMLAQITKHQAFDDVNFAKLGSGVACQAESCAIIKALSDRGQLKQATHDFDSFTKLVYDSDLLPENRQEQPVNTVNPGIDNSSFISNTEFVPDRRTPRELVQIALSEIGVPAQQIHRGMQATVNDKDFDGSLNYLKTHFPSVQTQLDNGQLDDQIWLAAAQNSSKILDNPVKHLKTPRSTSFLATLTQLPGYQSHDGNTSLNQALNQFSIKERNKMAPSYANYRKLNLPGPHLTEKQWKLLAHRTDEKLLLQQTEGIQNHSYLDPRYPQNWFSMKNQRFPLMAYQLGSTDLNLKSMAVIGSRETSRIDTVDGLAKLNEHQDVSDSNYVRQGAGKGLSQAMAMHFTNKDYTIVSGLANGADTFGHEATLNSNGRTVALVAGSLEQPMYPPEHAAKGHQHRTKNGKFIQGDGLADQIVDHQGSIVSEYLRGTKTFPDHGFAGQYMIDRDELQAGMVDGTFAVETDFKGGTTHAMNDTIEMDKPLAVPDAEKYLDLPTTNRNPRFYKDYQAIPKLLRGTQRVLDQNNALAIYSNDSVQSFEDAMDQGRKTRQFQKSDALKVIKPKRVKNRLLNSNTPTPSDFNPIPKIVTQSKKVHQSTAKSNMPIKFNSSSNKIVFGKSVSESKSNYQSMTSSSSSAPSGLRNTPSIAITSESFTLHQSNTNEPTSFKASSSMHSINDVSSNTNHDLSTFQPSGFQSTPHKSSSSIQAFRLDQHPNQLTQSKSKSSVASKSDRLNAAIDQSLSNPSKYNKNDPFAKYSNEHNLDK